MQVHELKRTNRNKKSRQVGRGGKRGKTSGRGTKGQKARAGRKIRPEIRDLIKRLPKKRGYAFSSVKEKPVIINLKDIEKNFKDGEEVNPESIQKIGLISKKNLKRGVKILSEGDLTKKVVISNCSFSSKTKEKIEKSGSKIG